MQSAKKIVDFLECGRHTFQVLRLEFPPFALFLDSHLEPLESHV